MSLTRSQASLNLWSQTRDGPKTQLRLLPCHSDSIPTVTGSRASVLYPASLLIRGWSHRIPGAGLSCRLVPHVGTQKRWWREGRGTMRSNFPNGSEDMFGHGGQ